MSRYPAPTLNEEFPQAPEWRCESCHEPLDRPRTCAWCDEWLCIDCAKESPTDDREYICPKCVWRHETWADPNPHCRCLPHQQLRAMVYGGAR